MTRRQLLYLIAAIVIFFLSLILRTILVPSNLPKNDPVPAIMPYSQNQPLPKVSAHSIFILDSQSRQVLFQQNSDSPVYPASTTKMMTALVVIDSFPLSQTITVSRAYPDGQNANLQPGEKITVEQLLYAMLVDSANDAAEILAENFPGGRLAFVAAMNSKAVALHLTHTHFQNPTGLDETNHYSSAADLTRLAQAVLDHPFLAKIVSTENVVISTNNSPHVLSNVNQLLGRVPGVLGIKTGFTDLAGQSLVTYVKRQDHPVIITVLGSTDRFTDSVSLINWVYSNFTWQPSTTSGQLPVHKP